MEESIGVTKVKSRFDLETFWSKLWNGERDFNVNDIGSKYGGGLSVL